MCDCGIGKEKNIDIIINKPFWNKDSDIVAIISSKKQGQPITPLSEMPIPTRKNSSEMNNFIKWVKAWDYSYSKAGLRQWRKLQRKALEFPMSEK